jgi:hypothetical protein
MRQSETQPLPPMLVRRIKTLQGLSGIGEEDYRSLLWGYGVESCKDLAIPSAHAVIGVLQRMVDKIPERRAAAPKRYAEIKGRSVLMATAPQLRMLEAMWMQVTRQGTPGRAREAYAEWLRRRYGIASVEWIQREEVGKIKRALEAMGAEKLD